MEKLQENQPSSRDSGTKFEVGQTVLFTREGINRGEMIGTISGFHTGSELIEITIPDQFFGEVTVNAWGHEIIKILTEEDDPEYFI